MSARSTLWRDIRAVFRGDLRLQLRDPIAILMLLVLPILVVPLLSWGMGALVSAQRDALADRSLGAILPAEIAAALEPGDLIEAVAGPLGEGPEGAVAEVVVETERILVRYQGTSTYSRTARDRLVELLERRREGERAELWAAAGLDLRPDEVLAVKVKDLAAPGDRSGLQAGRLAPVLLIFMVIGTGLYVSLDLFCGEKERGTIETLLTSRVDRRAVAAARSLMVLAFALLTGLLALASLAMTVHFHLLPTQAGAQALQLGAAEILLMVGMLLPLAVQLTALLVLTSAWAPDFKTGQALALPVMLGTLVPAGVVAMPTLQATPLLALVPITNLSLMMRDLLAGQAEPGLMALTLAATAVQAGLAVWWTSRLMGREAVLLGGGLGRARGQGRHGAEAGGLFLLAMVSFWFLGQLAQAQDLIWGMVFTQILLFGGLALSVRPLLGLPLRPTLSLRPPQLADLGLALLLGLCTSGPANLLLRLQAPWMPMPSALGEEMTRALTEGIGPAVMVLCFALLPGICEELFFRGALLGLLKKSLRPLPRILVVGLLFGLMHLSLPRILPTGILGVIFGALALRSGSILVPIFAHATHNGFLLIGSQQGWMSEELPPIGQDLALTAAAGLCLFLVGRRGR